PTLRITGTARSAAASGGTFAFTQEGEYRQHFLWHPRRHAVYTRPAPRELTDPRGNKAWRRDRDSNPGGSFPPTRFPSVRLQPLGHLSGDGGLLVTIANRLVAVRQGSSSAGPRRILAGT